MSYSFPNWLFGSVACTGLCLVLSGWLEGVFAATTLVGVIGAGLVLVRSPYRAQK